MTPSERKTTITLFSMQTIVVGCVIYLLLVDPLQPRKVAWMMVRGLNAQMVNSSPKAHLTTYSLQNLWSMSQKTLRHNLDV